MAQRFATRRHRPLALALLALVALAALALAPAAAAAPMTGFTVALGDVVDTAGAPLAGATLTFTLGEPPVEVGHPPSPIREHPPGPIRVATNGGGHFQVLLLAGTYAVTAELNGYEQVNQDNDSIIIQKGVVARYRFVMRADSAP